MSASLAGWPQEPAAVKRLREAGCEMRFRPRRRTVMSRVGRRIFGGTDWQWIAASNPDLVVISQGGNRVPIDIAQTCNRAGIQTAFIFQAASDMDWVSDDRAREGAAYLEKAAGVFFVSKANRSLVQRQYGIILEHAQIVRNPFNVSYEANPPWPGERDGASWACVGRLSPKHKGQDLLLDVLALPKWRERPLRVTLYGDGSNRWVLERMCQMHGLKSVEFGGYVDDIQALWARHHALVLPSRIEGLPLAIVEAMLCRRPCIVTDVAGNAELMEDNVSGFVAVAPTVQALDEAMERAWQKRNDWRAIGEVAGRAVRSQVPADPAGEFAEILIKLATR